MSVAAREREVAAKAEAREAQAIAKMSVVLEPYRNKHKGQEVLVLGNGPSLIRYDLGTVPSHVVTMGLNQSWRVYDSPTYHVCVDDGPHYKGLGLWTGDQAKTELSWIHPSDKARIKHTGGGQQWFNEHADRLFCTSAWPIGIHLPFANTPRLSEKFSGDVATGGVVVSVNGCGSVLYVALQLCEFMGFSRIWIVGMDQTDRKFTGQQARAHEQDRLFRETPQRVRELVRVVEPSATKVFQVERWPWST